MRDALIALAALASFSTFVGIPVWEVPEPSLIAVVAVVILFAAFDFALELRRKKD